MKLSLKFSFVVLALTFIYALPGCGQIKSKPSDGKDAFFSFYSLKAYTLEGDSIDFSKFRGKKVLIVNTASSYVINLHRKCVLFSAVLLVVGVIEH